MTITFFDPETGKALIGETERSKTVGETTWHDTTVNGTRWAVPKGWPNNASPICEESEPEAYAEIFGE